MGNMQSTCLGRGRNRSHLPPPLPPPRPPRPIARNSYPAAAPYPSQYPNPNPPRDHPYRGNYPQQPAPVPHRPPYRNWVGRAAPLPDSPLLQHREAVTVRNNFRVRNNFNILKHTLRVEPDEDNPRKYLISFTFDAAAPGRITLMFFAKESEGGHLIATRKSQLKPVTVDFQQGIGQLFRQPPGTGVNSSMLREMDVGKDGDVEICPVMVKGEAYLLSATETDSSSSFNSQITQAVIEKGKHDYNARVVKQILFINGQRYELQEIYGKPTRGDFNGNDSGNRCVICLSEPRDTAVLPCGHMCACVGCAKDLMFRTNRCPICRHLVERLMEIKVLDK